MHVRVRRLRAGGALAVFGGVPLGTRRRLLLYRVCGDLIIIHDIYRDAWYVWLFLMPIWFSAEQR